MEGTGKTLPKLFLIFYRFIVYRRLHTALGSSFVHLRYLFIDSMRNGSSEFNKPIRNSV